MINYIHGYELHRKTVTIRAMVINKRFMKAIETKGMIDHKGQIILSEPLKVTSESQVKIIILFSDVNDISP